jgi:hypothetical protein
MVSPAGKAYEECRVPFVIQTDYMQREASCQAISVCICTISISSAPHYPAAMQRYACPCAKAVAITPPDATHH